MTLCLSKGPIPLFALAASFGLACTGALAVEEDLGTTNTHVMAASAEGDALYVASAEHGRLVRVPTGPGDLTEIELGRDPTRVARLGERLFVTLRGDRSIAVVEDLGTSLRLHSTVELGAEPFGVVAHAGLGRIYVAVSMENRVDELDATSFELLRSFPIGDQPRWLAVHPSGQALYVASAIGRGLATVDLDSGEVSELRFDGRLARRFTGDIAVSSEGTMLVAPVLDVDHTREVVESSGTEQADGYAGDDPRFVPSVLVFAIDPERPAAPTVSGTVLVEAPVTASGYFASATLDAESEAVWLSVEGGNAVVLLDVPFDSDTGRLEPSRHQGPNADLVLAPSGARGVVLSATGEAFVYSFIDRTVARLGRATLRDSLERHRNGDHRVRPGFMVAGAREVGEETLSSAEAEGRRLFYAANDPRVTTPGQHVSCATCHFDGRNDGLTWHFSRGPRQTPSLAGRISTTAPVGWEGDRPTVAEDAASTSEALMGGSGLTSDEALAIEAFIDTIPRADATLRGLDMLRVERGRALFEREDVGCATCHTGTQLTDNEVYSMNGLLRVKTRSLVGIAATPPYLHDGRAKTLDEVVELSRDGAMGSTGQLSDEERRDLVFYLRSL